MSLWPWARLFRFLLHLRSKPLSKDLSIEFGAGKENRTPVFSLEGCLAPCAYPQIRCRGRSLLWLEVTFIPMAARTSPDTSGSVFRVLLNRLRRGIRFALSSPVCTKVVDPAQLPNLWTYTAPGCMCHNDLRGASAFSAALRPEL